MDFSNPSRGGSAGTPGELLVGTGICGLARLSDISLAGNAGGREVTICLASVESVIWSSCPFGRRSQIKTSPIHKASSTPNRILGLTKVGKALPLAASKMERQPGLGDCDSTVRCGRLDRGQT